MKKTLRLVLCAFLSLQSLALGSTELGQAQGTPRYPLWMKLLKWLSGDTNATQVEVTTMSGDPHMQMAVLQPVKLGDEERAAELVEAARHVIRRYADVRTAERDSYRRFGPPPKVGDEVHYVSLRYGHAEAKALNPMQPGSLLYRRTPQGMRAVGVMYSARGDATPEELDAVAPLSIAHWHRHVNFCGAPTRAPASESSGPGARYGFQGSIHTERECRDAGGLWIPLAFGWMTHIYPDEQPGLVWGGEHMKAGDAGVGHHH